MTEVSSSLGTNYFDTQKSKIPGKLVKKYLPPPNNSSTKQLIRKSKKYGDFA